jgi:hypothetical protein
MEQTGQWRKQGEGEAKKPKRMMVLQFVKRIEPQGPEPRLGAYDRVRPFVVG